jgi:hypothetical protein
MIQVCRKNLILGASLADTTIPTNTAQQPLRQPEALAGAGQHCTIPASLLLPSMEFDLPALLTNRKVEHQE